MKYGVDADGFYTAYETNGNGTPLRIRTGLPSTAYPYDKPSLSQSDEEVNHPGHYTAGKIEVIDFLEDQKLDFRAANVIKYVCRARLKGKYLSDLKKARWYLDRLIAEQENAK